MGVEWPSPSPLADQILAQLSNWPMYSAIAVYLLAFLAACAEWTFGTSGKIARASADTAETAGKQTPAAPVNGRVGSAVARAVTGSSTKVLAPPAAATPETTP
jgi:hypothetical protein